MNFQVIFRNWPLFASGLETTLELTALTLVGGLLIGTPLAIARASHFRAVRYPAFLFIETVRGAPELMLIFWVYFMLPRVVGHPISAWLAASVALIAFNSAYCAEIIRAGINAVNPGNIEAGRATGLDWFQIMRAIILPQAFSTMTPALISQVVMAFKATALVSVIGVTDIFKAGTIVNNREFQPFTILLFIALIYFIPDTMLSYASRFYGDWTRRRRGLA